MKSNNANSDDKSESINEVEWLLIVRSSNKGYQEYILKPGENNIGRETDNDIVLQDNTTSSCHAKIHYDQIKNIVAIQDNESTNGTFVNSRRIHKRQTLDHEDQIRVGSCLMTINHFKLQPLHKQNARVSKTNVTSELILESIDQYGVLLFDIGQRLANIPDLDAALMEITELLKRMIAAEECQIIMADQFEKMNERGVPTSLAKKIIKNKTATIFSNTDRKSPDGKDKNTTQKQSTSLMLIVPVMVDEKVVALIFARKSINSSNNFYNSDLQLVLAISNQVAMSIQRYQVEKELIHNSNHDALTNLPNRTLFLDRLRQSIARSKQEKGFEFAVLFFDIDNFKVVNDSLGHATGDKMLIAVAERLKHNIRNIDVVSRDSVIARFGGDEFAILLEDVKESLFALATATRLRKTLSRPYNIDGKKIFSSVSIGVAVSTIGYESPEDILQDADIAMYKAKELGKERVEIYDVAMRDHALERMRIGMALREGVIQKEFRLHYQPIVSLQTGRVAGYEALLRWYTPNQGILNPDDFMYAIDTANLIYSTDHWVLQNACRQAVEWQNKFSSTPPLYISVNLSAKNIKHPNLVDNIYQVLQETKLDPRKLCLEITEKTSAPNDESTIEVLRKLRSIGIQISLDDFGTGYSALNYLAQFPVDVLKIDQSFIKMIGKKDGSNQIVEMIKALATHLGIIVVAEGVEKVEQMEFLKSINCEYAQGYFYSKPLDARSTTELLKKGYQWEQG